MSPGLPRRLERLSRTHGRGWRWALAAIGWITVVSGVVQMFLPGTELRLMQADASAAPAHFFRIVGMFMVLFGGLLLHGLHEPRANPAAFLWSGLQKVGACLMVAVAVARGLLSPVSLLVAAFDALSAALVLGFYVTLRQREQVISVLKPPSEVEPGDDTGPVSVAPIEPGVEPFAGSQAAFQGEAAEPRRSLVLAGGGMRVAWQSGVLRALTDKGLTFAHADGTSGGIITLAMWLSGLSPAEMCERWRTLRVKDFVSLMPLDAYARPWRLEALGDADGIVERVFPHLGIDVDAVRASRERAGTFNVCDFGRKTNEAIPHTDVDRDLLVAGISLPLFMPPVSKDGRLYLDSVWIQDANVMEAVRRGADEVWVVWCIGNTSGYGKGFFHQYVNMIELSANGALFAQLEQVRELNARILAGEHVPGHPRPIVVHLIKPERPLPLDPDFYAGHVTAASLIDQGYSDACRYLRSADPQGLPLNPEITQMTESAPELTFRETMSGPLALGTTDPEAGAHDGRSTLFTMHCTISIDDMDAFVRDPSHAARLVAHIQYRPLGDDLPVQQGSFNLFRPTDDPTTQIMSYGLNFQAHDREYYLEGTKTLHDDAGPDLWRDTTRLYCHLHEGTDARGPVVGSGILVLSLRELLQLVTSMRSSREGVEGLQIITRFGKLFMGALWDLYSLRARGGSDAKELHENEV
ncbi:patatin-like phospholipase family protein [Corallococcus praedator]|uniref:Patatin-like phospholipase family protein n=1 Tax=Corallococcus praedator TaxID=2316724 RepID=A0ABX9QPD9_9BACT|nr:MULTISPECIES: patatin-like phospholipase family protein [Corallococcus]RKH34443.1 patatin-like phospholipase family protein [Corallococcus sp. CA031C]RKI15504.1 patatin-like phospholipase family protein [Corallococcus praedator]